MSCSVPPARMDIRADRGPGFWHELPQKMPEAPAGCDHRR
jgi:hypothetical protein